MNAPSARDQQSGVDSGAERKQRRFSRFVGVLFALSIATAGFGLRPQVRSIRCMAFRGGIRMRTQVPAWSRASIRIVGSVSSSRSLAYRVKKNRKGHYMLLGLDAKPAFITEMERRLRLNEDVLRFMTLRVDEIEEAPSAILSRKSDERERASIHTTFVCDETTR